MKKTIFLILLLVFAILPTSVTGSEPSTGHPYLLFHDISEVPGYQYRTQAPWSGWESGIISSADESLTRDFTVNSGTAYDRLLYRGKFARDLGLAYQITKKPVYAAKAREALLNLDVGTVMSKSDRSSAVGTYALAYDWIQPTLSTSDNTIIRDKLAKLASTVYTDLNDGGTTRGTIDFYDYLGSAYPNMGIVGAALADYTNPNKLVLSSTPADWHKVGTEYLFVNDPLHSYGRSLFSFGFDESSGKALNGAYKSYIIEDFAWWLQVYGSTYSENPLEKYPAAKRAFTAELWDSLPNGYSSNYVTNGDAKWLYHRAFMNLYDATTKSNALDYYERLDASTLLPYSTTLDSGSSVLQYCVYGNYASILRARPTTTSHLDTASIFQVFRENWDEDSDWLSLVTFNTTTRSNRDSAHMDQLSFEYYSRGDLLLADAGEPKHLGDYGQNDIHHNTIALEDPRSSFPVSPWSGSTSAGIFKGYTADIMTPSTVDTAVQVPWIQFLQSEADLTYVMVGSWLNEKALTSPIHYERTILYPDSDYFIVVDRMEGTEPWVYRNIFRPTSLTITPTADSNKDGAYAESEIGHVNGALTLGSTSYNWQALPYKTETRTGITTNSLTWTTTNPSGKAVTMNLFSSPSSEILLEKNVGRISGYDARSEVYNPVVWFRTPATTAEYRVTALLSSYSTEQAKTVMEIPVTGTGHALKVTSASSDDYIYTGKGISSFAGFTTDADTVFIRQGVNNMQVALLWGSYLKYKNDSWITLSKKTDAITANREENYTNYRIQGEPDIQGDIFQQPVDSNMIDKRTRSKEQQKSVFPDETSFASVDTGDIPIFLVNLAKKMLSLFPSI